MSANTSKNYWRSLEELAGTANFQDYLRHEFPADFEQCPDLPSRRQILQLLGASLALAGLSSCAKPPAAKIVPYVRAPEEVVPGKPLFFATAMPFSGVATGLLVESHLGRPTKVEGNPQHPFSLGATDVFAQAAVLTLYDPDRSQVITHLGRVSSWVAFLAAISTEREAQHLRKGVGLRILTETVTSPTLADQLRALLKEFPAARWHQWEPAGRDGVRAGARLAFGQYINTYYDFEKAAVVLALDADFLCSGPGSLRYARQFAARRRDRSGAREMNRLYVVETTPSSTGTMADHRLRLRPSEMENFALAVAQQLGAGGQPPASRGAGPGGPGAGGPHAGWVGAVARDLAKHRGSSVVVAGDQQPPVIHALAHAMNQALGNTGQTVFYTDPVEANPVDQLQSLGELVEDMKAGAVETLVILGGNPVFTAPDDLQFAQHLSKVKLRIHSGLYDDETTVLCHWHVPETHFLESWSDGRAPDGTISIIQPLIAPLYEGRSAHELIAALSGKPERSGYDIVRDYWKSQKGEKNFEEFWRTALHDGLIAGTALPVRPAAPAGPGGPGTSQPPASRGAGRGGPGAGGLEIVFRPDPTIWDGRFANNGWLQELPKPLTKLTWDNAALVSPATAQRLGLASEDVVELRYRGRSLRAPVWILPGQADDCVTVHLGYGRTRAGRVGTGVGFNAYGLRTSQEPWSGQGLEVVKTGSRYPLACTQQHQSMEGRNLARAATLEEYRQNPHFAQEGEQETPQSLYPGFPQEGYAWGMAIDLGSCVGCNACVVACQAENNSPVVGKEQVMRGREMHWLRIDRYYQGGLENPETYYQPVLCMHCENAPCEVVCPVGATLHSPEGLNEMVYNRCVGTRYCSNNCPYKVRRFNFLQYSDWDTPSLKMMRNPNVTVRSRGVMEKCTYCVQRINAAKIEAEKEDRQVRDGEIVTACQAACPAQAIVFGNIHDPNSRVARLKADSLHYGLLSDLNTRPRTTYLARLKNPNPEIQTD